MRLVQMHGLPGSGKSALASALAPHIDAVVLDKDVLKSALLRTGMLDSDAGAAAYDVVFDIAEDLMRRGQSVVLDSPAFWPVIVEKGQRIARDAGASYFMLECACDDERELRRRLASRTPMISQPREPLDLSRYPGTADPSCERLRLDTTRPLDELVPEALAYLTAMVAA